MSAADESTATPADVRIDVHLDEEVAATTLRAETRRGLTADEKWLPPVWFYDDAGCRLFEEITRLPEYYPTRTERQILEHYSQKLVESIEVDTLVELGSGTSEKTRVLLDALHRAGQLSKFVPFDVSEGTLRAAAEAISVEYGIPVHGVVGDFNHHLDRIPGDGRRLVAFLGGTIGNLDPAERSRFFFDVDAALRSSDAFLLGADLVKEPERLIAAYDDAAGVTASFNLNVLRRLNRELGADFDLEQFAHRAVWNADEAWIEMRLRAVREQRVHIPALDLEIAFDAGEELRTEISAKFTVDGLVGELWDAGLVVDQAWTDPAGDFAVVLASPYC